MDRARTTTSTMRTASRKAVEAAAIRQAAEQRVAAEQQIDAAVRREVASAQQALARAMAVCRGSKVGSTRLSRVTRDLGRALYSLSNIGTVFNPYADDLTEEERSAKFWADRAAEAARQEAATQASAAPEDGE